jgi:hypothetical protein
MELSPKALQKSRTQLVYLKGTITRNYAYINMLYENKDITFEDRDAMVEYNHEIMELVDDVLLGVEEQEQQ